MDFSELTKIVLDRIRKLEPENFRKIIGLILLNEPSEPEMIHLACSPENTLLTRIDEVKTMFNALSPVCSLVSSENPSSSFHSLFHASSQYWDHQVTSDPLPLCDNNNIDYTPRTYPDSTEESLSLFNHSQFFNMEDASFGGNTALRTSRSSLSLPEVPIKACHYYYKGYCKHGANCRYFHGQQSFPDDHLASFSQSLNDLQSEEHRFLPGSLEKLEMEITELLRSQKGMPVSIASLPMLYYTMYGRNLQANGYLTESQRHGKAGFSLTKLLACLKNSIRLIDRPHGQHSVILAEDVPRYLEFRNERTEKGSMSATAHQIYLTFPSESTFTEDDVSNYFKQFGPVKDVRIPCQEKRMFGFVSFIYSETVSEILTKRMPHFICGARVLVKPYREKTRTVDSSKEFESSRELKVRFEEQESLLELERTRLSEFSLFQKPLNQQSYLSHGLGDFSPFRMNFRWKTISATPLMPQIAAHPRRMKLELQATVTIILRGEKENIPLSYSSCHEETTSTSSSVPIDLPESPFAVLPPVGSSISAVI
ncbi:Zinc finger CCCH domain-containing protein 18 [Platanthera guangdongensis]|uniref:Zinc finger CCCH domain-containing protein 18 n=1 Tax=Platanthera guangdongensis TaxID=2320717 RepID=A0ABR2M5S2_9ASPA